MTALMHAIDPVPAAGLCFDGRLAWTILVASLAGSCAVVFVAGLLARRSSRGPAPTTRPSRRSRQRPPSVDLVELARAA